MLVVWNDICQDHEKKIPALNKEEHATDNHEGANAYREAVCRFY
jgi:hypothetical protein